MSVFKNVANTKSKFLSHAKSKNMPIVKSAMKAWGKLRHFVFLAQHVSLT